MTESKKQLLSYFNNSNHNNSLSGLNAINYFLLVKKLKKSYNSFLKQKDFIKTNKEISFQMNINKDIQIANARIFATHFYGINKLKKQRKKHYIMITAFLKNISNLETDKEKLIQIRKFIINELIKIKKRNQYYYNKKGKKYELIYLGVIEIDKNNHLHLHFYIYEDFNKSERDKIENNIKKYINNSTLKGQVDLKITKYKILDKDFNYSNLYHNINKKMKGQKKENKVVLFTMKKLFSQNRLITHSRLPFTIKALQEEMKKKLKQKIKISYPTLACQMIQNELKIISQYKKLKLSKPKQSIAIKRKQNLHKGILYKIKWRKHQKRIKKTHSIKYKKISYTTYNKKQKIKKLSPSRCKAPACLRPCR